MSDGEFSGIAGMYRHFRFGGIGLLASDVERGMADGHGGNAAKDGGMPPAFAGVFRPTLANMNLDKSYFGDVVTDTANRVVDPQRLTPLVDPVPHLEMLRTRISNTSKGFPPASMLAICYDNLRGELNALMEEGYAIYVFEQTKPAQVSQTQKIEQFHKTFLVKDIAEKLRQVEACLPTYGRISRAVLVEIGWSSLFDAVCYCNKYYSWTSIFLSKKGDFFSVKMLEKIFACGNYELDALWFSTLNKGSICAGICEQDTIVIRSDGGFGDEFAEIQLVGVETSLARISKLSTSVLHEN